MRHDDLDGQGARASRVSSTAEARARMRQRSPEQHLPYEPPLKLRRCLTCLTRGNGPSPGLCSDALQITYVSHLTENGLDRRFIQVQVGHEADSSTAIYTHVSSDFMNTALRKALSPALDSQPG